ncbi:MaoC family dehydratase [Salipiger abyssi]|uniref:MaoC family dehydratase n=1 Tax=Salipiger abyssi TaxID=1250539 RepID=UPI001A900A29|nr:MaoC/PaaZ C-terminal domain-containing protein [Salipiger abyssi]MBN9889344.1 MaoC family dehydratase N-terminal domain-containing protein [Salipiger abyssi]
MAGLYFEEYTDDWERVSATRTITEEMVAEFVALCEFTSPTYTDPDYSQRLYSGRLVPGIFVLSIAEGLILNDGLTSKRGIYLLELTPKFLKPSFAGDTIHNVVTLHSKRLTSKPDRGVVVTNHDVVNQKGEVVINYTSTRMIRTRAFVEPETAGA